VLDGSEEQRVVFRTIQNDALEDMIFVSSNCHDEGLGRALSPVLGRALHSQLGRALLANGIHGFIPGAIERALYVQVMATLKKQFDVSPHVRPVRPFVVAPVQLQQTLTTERLDVFLALVIVDEHTPKVRSKTSFVVRCWLVVGLICLQQYAWRRLQQRLNAPPIQDWIAIDLRCTPQVQEGSRIEQQSGAQGFIQPETTR